jgi:hypothetical protein
MFNANVLVCPGTSAQENPSLSLQSPTLGHTSLTIMVSSISRAGNWVLIRICTYAYSTYSVL